MVTAVAAPATAAAPAAAVVRLVAGDYEITFQFQRLDRTEHRRRRLGRCCRLLLLLLLLVLLGSVMVGRQFGRSRCRRHSRRVVVVAQRFGQRHVECRRFTASGPVGSAVTNSAVESRRDAKGSDGRRERIAKSAERC